MGGVNPNIFAPPSLEEPRLRAAGWADRQTQR